MELPEGHSLACFEEQPGVACKPAYPAEQLVVERKPEEQLELGYTLAEPHSQEPVASSGLPEPAASLELA